MSSAIPLVQADFRRQSAPPRLPPFSIRLSPAERAQLRSEAQGMPLGAYIKAKALGTPPLKTASRIADRQALGQALALLGKTHYANNLNQLAHLANMGALPLTPEVIEELESTLKLIGEVRSLILQAIGIRKDA